MNMPERMCAGLTFNKILALYPSDTNNMGTQIQKSAINEIYHIFITTAKLKTCSVNLKFHPIDVGRTMGLTWKIPSSPVITMINCGQACGILQIQLCKAPIIACKLLLT